MTQKPTLKRNLTLPLLILYGLGNILGAGIYVLVGKVAGEAGYGAVLAFLVAMVVAALTAFSYMEFAARYPVSAGVSVYAHKAFRQRWLSLGLGIVTVMSGVASAAALSQGFAGYLNTIVSIPTGIASVGLLVVLGLIAIRGIGESAWFAAGLTLLEIAGLALVIWAGKDALAAADYGRLFSIDPTVGLAGLAAGAFLAFYAFIGFEDMVNVVEEVKRPRRNMPLAILVSLLVATALYLLVAVVALGVVGPAELAASNAPLALVYERAGFANPVVLTTIGMIAAINGVIVQIIMGSRILYGLSRQGWIHERFSDVHTTMQTPVKATLLVVGVMIIGTLLLPLVSLAQFTSLLVLTIFAVVNTGLVVVKLRQAMPRPDVNVPLVIPIAGSLSSILLIVWQFTL